jgi:DNA-binding transcriptional ArsR family regulator
MMHAFEVLGDPVRRCIIELLVTQAQASGAIVTAIQRDFTVTQSAVSQYLRVLRDHGFATVRADGARRVYALNPRPLQDIDPWLNGSRRFWEPKLDALATEIIRRRAPDAV